MPKILIVDDDAAITRLISMTLRTEGYDIDTAGNGEIGLERVAASAPDVIVLDLQMPVMDGRTFFRQLRAMGDATPIVILSAYGARDAAGELAANAFLGKPFDPMELADKIRTLIAA